MSDDFNQGANKLRQTWNVSEFVVNAAKHVAESMRDKKLFQEYLAAIGQQGQKNPVIDATNTTLFDTTGHDPKVLSAICTKLNIPNAVLVDSDTKTSLLAVPNQFARQANKALSYSSTLYTQIGTRISKKELDVIMANSGTPPAPSAAASLLKGDAVVKSFDSARWMPLAQKLESEGIPFAIAQRGNVTDVIFDPMYSIQVDHIDKEIEYTHAPSELSYAEFMKHNLGRNIVEYPEISAGQARLLRESLCGSSLGYNLQPNGNTYILRCTAQQAQYVTPIVAATTALAYGPNEQALNEHALNVQEKAKEAFDLAMTEQPASLIDAEKTYERYSITKEGLKGPNGQITIRRSAPQFAEKVYNVVNNMHAPIVKSGDAAATTQEIALAKNTAAKAQPSEAQVLASQILSLKAVNALSEHNNDMVNVTRDIVDGCQTLSNAVEEENFRLSPEELAKEFKLHGAPDEMKRLTELAPKLSADERTQLRDVLATTSMRIKKTLTKEVESQDLSLHEIEKRLDNNERDEQVNDRWKREQPSQPENTSATPIGIDDLGVGGQ